MRDWMGRDLHYLRVSLTERCNLKCIYCREENAHCKAKKELGLKNSRGSCRCLSHWCHQSASDRRRTAGAQGFGTDCPHDGGLPADP